MNTPDIAPANADGVLALKACNDKRLFAHRQVLATSTNRITVHRWLSEGLAKDRSSRKE
jgi:hypothetical protein